MPQFRLSGKEHVAVFIRGCGQHQRPVMFEAVHQRSLRLHSAPAFTACPRRARAMAAWLRPSLSGRRADNATPVHCPHGLAKAAYLTAAAAGTPWPRHARAMPARFRLCCCYCSQDQGRAYRRIQGSSSSRRLPSTYYVSLSGLFSMQQTAFLPFQNVELGFFFFTHIALRLSYFL